MNKLHDICDKLQAAGVLVPELRALADDMDCDDTPRVMANLVRALCACTPHVDVARRVSGGDGDLAARIARVALRQYVALAKAQALRRDLADDESKALRLAANVE